MKPTDDIDKKLGALLKEQAHQSADNEWFARRVINRLPPRPAKGYELLAVVIYFICVAVCLFGWAAFVLTLNPNVILVKDALVAAALVIATGTVLWQGIHALLNTHEM